MNTKAFFPCWERSNLILEQIGKTKYFFLKIPDAVKFFTKLSINKTLMKKQIITHPDGFV